MSDRPSDLRLPELKDVVIAVKDVAEWYELGLQLGLPDATLASIATHPNIEGHRRMMLSKWLQYDPKASWEKLAAALSKIGKNVIAANVRRQFVASVATQSTPPATNVESASSNASSATPARKGREEEENRSTDKEAGPLDNAQVEQDENKRLAVAETVLGKIRSQFSLLVIKVRSAMQRNKVEALDVHQFLVTYFEGECNIPEDSNLTKIFNAMTTTKLWRYDHYGPLKDLAESFLPDDDPARARVTEYDSQLTGFQATTRIIDFVKLNELEDREEIPDRLFSPKKYNSHYQKFTMKLGLARDAKGASELTLEYVDKLWKALMKEFHLPPLTAVMDKIVEGSLTITWLLLPHIIEKIRATYFKSVNFFEQNNIITINLYDDDDDYGLMIYDEEWMTGSTPLFRASFAGNIDEVKDLLEGGADVNEANDDKEGMTPLMGACWTGRTDVAKLLLDHKATVDYKDKKEGWSALHFASAYGHTATVMVLMEYGAQVNLLTNGEWTPLMGACTTGYTDIARVLLKHGANVDHCDEEGWSVLMAASANGQEETVAVLLEYKAQVNLPDQDGWTALTWAVDRGYADTARLLLEKGATVDFEDDIWKESLRDASEHGFSETVEVMLEHGAPVNLVVDEEEGNAALGVACKNGEAETARILLNHGATIDDQNKEGQSALHLASVGGHTQTVAVLIEKGGQLNLQDQDGWTALLLATKQGHLETIKLLLEHGAAVDIESKSGLTAVKVAQSDAHQDVCDILLQYIQQGAKVTTPQQEESESTQEEETKAELAEEPKEWDTQQESAKVKSPQEGEDDDSQRLPEDIRQKRRDSEKQEEGRNNREQQDTNTELTEAQRAEVRSVGERIWEQVKRVFLRELVKKEQMRSEQETSSEHIIQPTKQRRSMLSFFPRRGQRTRRQGRRPVVGRAPAAEH